MAALKLPPRPHPADQGRLLDVPRGGLTLKVNRTLHLLHLLHLLLLYLLLLGLGLIVVVDGAASPGGVRVHLSGLHHVPRERRLGDIAHPGHLISRHRPHTTTTTTVPVPDPSAAW